MAVGSWHAPLRQRRARVALVITLLWALMVSRIFKLLSTGLDQVYALSAFQIGLVYSLMAGASVIANLLVATLNDRLGQRSAAWSCHSTSRPGGSG